MQIIFHIYSGQKHCNTFSQIGNLLKINPCDAILTQYMALLLQDMTLYICILGIENVYSRTDTLCKSNAGIGWRSHTSRFAYVCTDCGHDAMLISVICVTEFTVLKDVDFTLWCVEFPVSS